MLAAGIANLITGLLSKRPAFTKKALQILAAFAFLAAAIFATGNVFMRLAIDPVTAATPELTVYFLLAGLILHILCNLYLLNPAHSYRPAPLPRPIPQVVTNAKTAP